MLCLKTLSTLFMNNGSVNFSFLRGKEEFINRIYGLKFNMIVSSFALIELGLD